MSGVIAAAGIGAAGAIGGGLLARSAGGGAAQGSNVAAQQALAANQHQIDVNRADVAPWVQTGGMSAQQIGALLGYGSMYGTGQEGSTGQYGVDPNAYSNAVAQLRAYGNASGAKLPTATPIASMAAPTALNFTPSNVFTPANKSYAVTGSFQSDPSYAWRVEQGNKALDRSAAAKGNLLSGGQIKAATDYNSGVASQEYQNWYGRYMAQNQFNQGVNAFNLQGGLAQDAFNLQGNLATNAQNFGQKLATDQYNLGVNQQNFGQQQALYQDSYGQWRDALGDLYKSSGMGASAASGVGGIDSSLTNAGGNALITGARDAGNFNVSGANTLASGIGSGINNLISGLGYSGAFSPSAGGSPADAGIPGSNAAALAAANRYGSAPATYTGWS